jgi:hypothetical protein
LSSHRKTKDNPEVALSFFKEKPNRTQLSGDWLPQDLAFSPFKPDSGSRQIAGLQ